MKTLRLFLTLAAMTILAVRAGRAQHFPPDAQLTARLQSLAERGGNKGVVLGVLEADGTKRIVAYGSGGPDTRPLGRLSVFEIGSVTKSFTGILLADMVLKGEVALDDAVSKYLPATVVMPSRAGREITLLDVMTHQAGFPRRPTNYTPADAANPYAEFTVEKLYDFLKSFELPRDIGAQFEYSNVGVGLLGHALSRAAGGSYEQAVRRRILEPLGLRMTGSTLTPDMSAWMTKGHDPQGNVVPYWDSTDALAGAGALKSNAEDLLTLLAAAMATPTSPVHRAIRESQVKRKEINAQQSYGLGWYLQQRRGRTLVGHTGGTGGYSSFIGIDPDRKTGVVLLTNSRVEGQLASFAFELMFAPATAATASPSEK